MTKLLLHNISSGLVIIKLLLKSGICHLLCQPIIHRFKIFANTIRLLLNCLIIFLVFVLVIFASFSKLLELTSINIFKSFFISKKTTANSMFCIFLDFNNLLDKLFLLKRDVLNSFIYLHYNIIVSIYYRLMLLSPEHIILNMCTNFVHECIFDFSFQSSVSRLIFIFNLG